MNVSLCAVASCSNTAERSAFLLTDAMLFNHEIHVKLCREHYDEARDEHGRELPFRLHLVGTAAEAGARAGQGEGFTIMQDHPTEARPLQPVRHGQGEG
jgi:hypothetical protein